MPKVIVGMSGGVDSSITAYLLKEKGYKVEGVSFLMWESEKEAGAPACCSRQTTDDASKTARLMGIHYRTIDVRQDFKEKVVGPFIKAYLSGLTPNPCILCNRFIKFPYLIAEAEKRGAEYISTGHYAKVERSQDAGCRMQDAKKEKFILKKGIDPKKDQSYVLYTLTQEELARLILPLGNYKKDAVKKMAEKLGLPAAESSESQEICFVEEKNYLSFIEEFYPLNTEPGPIIEQSGEIIGEHKGIFGYTIGQRKRLGISSRAPLYVIGTDTEKNAVYVGPREAAKKREFFAEELNWIMPPKAYVFRAGVKVRSTMKGQPATITLLGSSFDSSFIPHPSSFIRVVFDEPQWAPAPGQSAVFYDGDIVIGGGVIRKPVGGRP